MGFTRTITTSIDSAEHNAERDQDAALIARVQAGEIQAFDALVNRYKVRLFAIIYNLTGNREDTADLLQDTLAALSLLQLSLPGSTASPSIQPPVICENKSYGVSLVLSL